MARLHALKSSGPTSSSTCVPTSCVLTPSVLKTMRFQARRPHVLSSSRCGFKPMRSQANAFSSPASSRPASSRLEFSRPCVFKQGVLMSMRPHAQGIKTMRLQDQRPHDYASSSPCVFKPSVLMSMHAHVHAASCPCMLPQAHAASNPASSSPCVLKS